MKTEERMTGTMQQPGFVANGAGVALDINKQRKCFFVIHMETRFTRKQHGNRGACDPINGHHHLHNGPYAVGRDLVIASWLYI